MSGYGDVCCQMAQCGPAYVAQNKGEGMTVLHPA